MKSKKTIRHKNIKPSVDTELQNYVRLKMAQAYDQFKNSCLRFFPELPNCFPKFQELKENDFYKICDEVAQIDEFRSETLVYKKINPDITIYYPDYFFLKGVIEFEAAIKCFLREKPYNALDALFSSIKYSNIYFTYLNQYYYTNGKIRNLETVSIVPPKIIEDIIIKKLGTSAATKKRISQTAFRRKIVEQIAYKFGWGKYSLNRMAQIVLENIKLHYSEKIKERDIETYKRDLRALKYRYNK